MSINITTLTAERFKRLKAGKMTFTASGLTAIGGKSEAGKTSVLDAIAYCLGGEKFRPSEPKNRDSKKPPYLKVELSNGLVVERSGKNSSLRVTDPSGEKAGQTLLDTIIDKMALDLPRFIQATPAVKAETLLKIIGVDDRLKEFDTKEKQLMDDRRIAGREADSAESVRDGLARDDTPPKELVSVTELSTQIGEAREMHDEQRESQRKLNDLAHDIECGETEIAELEASLKEAKELLANNSADMEKNQAAHAERFKDMPDLEAMEKKLSEADGQNELYRAHQRYAEAKTDAENKRKAHRDLDGDIQVLRDDRAALLDTAEMPLEGLSVVDGELVYNDSQWDCMSSAGQLKVATSIVKQLNPECGFVLIDRLERMDVETMAEFGAWAEAEGLQIIATRVSTGDECSIIIEEGECVDGR